MDIKQALIEAATEVLPMFGVSLTYDHDVEQKYLESASDINILIGLTTAIKGNVMLQFDRDTALKIVSAMMGGMEISDLDDMAKSALGEVTNMIIGSATIKMNSATLIDFTPPTIVNGEKVFLMISRVKSNKVKFKFGESEFNIAYCVE